MPDTWMAFQLVALPLAHDCATSKHLSCAGNNVSVDKFCIAARKRVKLSTPSMDLVQKHKHSRHQCMLKQRSKNSQNALLTWPYSQLQLNHIHNFSWILLQSNIAVSHMSCNILTSLCNSSPEWRYSRALNMWYTMCFSCTSSRMLAWMIQCKSVSLHSKSKQMSR